MATIELFVGSNNRTGRVDRERLLAVLGRHASGWTIRDARGYWNGSHEDSVSVLLDVPGPVERNALLDDVLDDCEQIAVAWHSVEPLHIYASAA